MRTLGTAAVLGYVLPHEPPRHLRGWAIRQWSCSHRSWVVLRLSVRVRPAGNRLTCDGWRALLVDGDSVPPAIVPNQHLYHVGDETALAGRRRTQRFFRSWLNTKGPRGGFAVAMPSLPSGSLCRECTALYSRDGLNPTDFLLLCPYAI